MKVLDNELPFGWEVRFQNSMVWDIEDALKEDGVNPEEATILQMKEKYGDLCVYLDVFSSRANKVIEEYESLARHTCVNCGKQTSLKWKTLPVCEKCYPKRRET